MRWLLVLVMLAGCDPRFKCGNNAQCAAGQVCMRIHPAVDDDGSQCVVPCSSSSADCDGGSCYCPDSPTGARCTVAGSSQNTGNFFCSP